MFPHPYRIYAAFVAADYSAVLCYWMRAGLVLAFIVTLS